MPELARSLVCIVTPGSRSANNGNWRTAARWASMLRGHCRVIVQAEWRGEPADALIALHARRSAASIEAFRAARPEAGLAVVLTGTDLYQDLPDSVEAARSLDIATRLVVLHEDAPALLRTGWRRKCEVVFQSAPVLAPARKPRDRLDLVAVGHLRAEKDPLTLFRAFEALPADLPVTLRHIGAGLDPELEHAARELAARDRRYRYAGALPHGLARAAIKRAHFLVHPSRIEGGANVVVEAVTAGTAVLASRISGNVGMLGPRYPGYFAPGDASELAARIVEACESREYRDRLDRACRERRALFSPAIERRAVRALASGLLLQGRR